MTAPTISIKDEAKSESPDLTAPPISIKDEAKRERKRDPADASMGILEEFDQSSDSHNLVWELASKGGADNFDRLRRLILEQEPRQLSAKQEDLVMTAVRAAGLIGATDDAAYNFSLQGCDPAFWKSNRKWTSERGDYSDDMLVSFSIQAVGLAGRDTTLDDITQLKTKRSKNYLHRFAGAITQAAFYEHMRRTKGGGALTKHMLGDDDDGAAFAAWINTEEGKKWIEWANDSMRGPRPPELSI